MAFCHGGVSIIQSSAAIGKNRERYELPLKIKPEFSDLLLQQRKERLSLLTLDVGLGFPQIHPQYSEYT